MALTVPVGSHQPQLSRASHRALRPLAPSVTAALSTFPGSEAFLREGRERYARTYLAALNRFAELPEDRGLAVMLGVIGAAEALAREVTAGRLDRLVAIDAISRIAQVIQRIDTVTRRIGDDAANQKPCCGS